MASGLERLREALAASLRLLSDALSTGSVTPETPQKTSSATSEASIAQALQTMAQTMAQASTDQAKILAETVLSLQQGRPETPSPTNPDQPHLLGPSLHDEELGPLSSGIEAILSREETEEATERRRLLLERDDLRRQLETLAANTTGMALFDSQGSSPEE